MKKVFIVIVALCMGLGCLTSVANARDLYLEAERADWFTAPLKLVTGSGQASDGIYIETDEDAGDKNSNPPGENDGWIVHTIYMPAGDYQLHGYMRKDGSDSYWVRIIDTAGNGVAMTNQAHSSGWARWNSLDANGSQTAWFRWDSVHDSDVSGEVPIVWTLPYNGRYQLQLARREDGTEYDAMFISSVLGLGNGNIPPDPDGNNTRPRDVSELAVSTTFQANEWRPVLTSPTNGQTGVLPTGSSLTWDAPASPPEALTGYVIYLGTTWEDVDPHGTPTPVAIVGAAELSYPLPALDSGTEYFYRVDARIKGGGDPNVAAEVASFATLTNDPVVTSQPGYAEAWRNDTATFSVAGTSGDLDDQDPLTYQWYDNAGAIGGATGTELVYTAGTEDQGIYCELTNNNATVQSDTATLHVRKWVAHYRFDEGSGSVVADSSPGEDRTTATPNDGTLEVAAEEVADYWTTEGKIGGALNMHGINSNTSEKVSTGKTASELGIGGNAPRTFSVWVYTRGWNEGAPYEIGNRSNGRNFSLRTQGTGTQQTDHWLIQYWGGDRGFWTWRNEGNRVAETRDWFFQTHKTWTHFVHTHDGERTKIYANGILIIDWIKGLDTGDGQTLKIGHWRNREFDGLIDDLQIFNYAFSLEEVIDRYVQGVPDAKFCQGSDPADVDGDCDVDLDDLESTAGNYLGTGIVP